MIETRLIEECRNGNISSFRKVVEITSPFIFSVAFRMLGNEDLSQDIVQETMITVWRKIHNIKSPESYKSWVYRITLNRCYDLMRKAKNSAEIHQDEKGWEIISNHLADSSVSEMENHENALIISLLTNSLSPKQKAVFILSEVEGMANEEVALITGMNKKSVKANLYHARRNIEGMIRKHLL